MNQPILGLRTVIYKVSDIGAARDWYAKAFSVEAYFDEPYYVGFNVSGYELGLQPIECDQGTNHEASVTYWGVEDIDAAYEQFIALGATQDTVPVDVGGGIKTATLLDPWGNVIGLIQNPHFKLP